jgi:hypothetical protein
MRLQSKRRFRVGERRGSQLDEPKCEADKESQPIQPAFVSESGRVHKVILLLIPGRINFEQALRLA